MDDSFHIETLYDGDSCESANLEQLSSFLRVYRLSQYYSVFVTEGFDRLLSLFDITEADLVSLNVKRGHRRLLQRAIATARGIPISTPIRINHGSVSVIPVKDQFKDEGYKSSRRRRQYIPSKPVTPFDELLNELKLEYEGLVLTDLVHIANARWNNFTGIEKEKYEREALHTNSDYVMGGLSRR